VNAISPGAIRTPMNVEKLTSPEIFDRVLLKLIPCKRIGEPEDIAQAAVWLASDQSDYLHGTTIYIDGGMTLYPASSAPANARESGKTRPHAPRNGRARLRLS